MQFTGEQLDPTGLYHLRAREYDPAAGRFTTTDPVAGSPGSPAVSSYGYVDNRPTVMIDPSGTTGVPADGRRYVQMASSTAAAEDVCGPRSIGAFLAGRRYTFGFPYLTRYVHPTIHSFRAALWTRLTRLPAHECRWRVRYGAIFESLSLGRVAATIHFGFVFAISNLGGGSRLWAPNDGKTLTVNSARRWPSEVMGEDELFIPHGSKPTTVHFVVAMTKFPRLPSVPLARRHACPLVPMEPTITTPGSRSPWVC
jgi:RHS repeat-associated protein